jgi:N-acetylmuramoyl-L-alanine amidase
MVDSILKDLKQTEWINEGGRLARVLGAELSRLPAIQNIEVSQIPVPILSGVQMPACLVELGFITNPSEEKRLRDRSYTKQLAKALTRGIMNFFESYR